MIRPATQADLQVIADFIRKLAEYERLSSACIFTLADLEQSLFGNRAYAEVLLAFEGDTPAGFALFFHNYSTFLAKPGIFLEDLFVEPEHRGKGLGKALLLELVKLARDRNCGRVEWNVLDWNEPSIEFYKSLGAKPMDEWRTFRLDAQDIERLGSS
jgi:GNAT superfamily N-acetyltransferase